MKKKLFWFVQNKSTSKLMFWVIAFLASIPPYLPESIATPDDKIVILSFILGLAIIWVAIYNLVPRQETIKELRKLHRGNVWVILLVITTFVAVQLYDRFFFLPKIKALKESYKNHLKSQLDKNICPIVYK